MIGVLAVFGPRPQQTAHFEAAQHRQVQVEDDQVDLLLAGELQGLVAACGNIDDGVAAAFEGVFDQA